MPVIIPPQHYAVTVHISGPSYTEGEALLTFGLRGEEESDAPAAAVATGVALLASGIGAFLPVGEAIPTIDAITETTSGLATTLIEGENEGAFPPPSLSVLLGKRTTVRGRRGQGRMYIPHLVPELNVDMAGLIAESYHDDLQDLADAFLASLVDQDYRMVILQGDFPEQKTPPLEVPPTVTRLIVDETMATQRRRMRH